MSKAPSGRELPTESGEGECVILKLVFVVSCAGSFHRYRGPPPSRREAFGSSSPFFVCTNEKQVHRKCDGLVFGRGERTWSRATYALGLPRLSTVHRTVDSLPLPLRVLSLFAQTKNKSTANAMDLFLAGAKGLEPLTCGFGDRRSTN